MTPAELLMGVFASLALVALAMGSDRWAKLLLFAAVLTFCAALASQLGSGHI